MEVDTLFDIWQAIGAEFSVDADGNFTKPALGFMKSKGLKEEDVVFKTLGKDEYIFGTIRQEGKETSEVLKTIVENFQMLCKECNRRKSNK